MAKIVLTADIHLGYPGKLDDVLYALTAIRRYMSDNEIQYCIIMGDLFHTRQSIATDVMHRSYEFFNETKNVLNQSWAVFLGNHDLFLKHSFKIHSLKMLSDVLDVYDKPCTISIDGNRFWILPYIHNEDVYMRAVGAIAKQSKPDDVLLTHIGVCGATLNECFLHQNWNIVNFDNFPLNVYSGHFHCTQNVGKLWYPGSPIPFNYAEGLVEHGFFVYDTETKTHEFIKTFDIVSEGVKPPDFATVVDSDIENLEEENVKGNKVRVALSHDYTNDERLELKKSLIDMGALEVAWMEFKKQDIDISDTKTDTLTMGNPEALLKTWFDLDKPGHIDYKMLSELNKEVVAEGNERVVEQGSTMEDE